MPAARRPKLGNARIAVAYLRTSTDEQTLGPKAQRAAIEAWAAREGIAVVAWHEEHLTSVTEAEDRPGFQAALADVRSFGAGVLAAHKRDRIARDPVIMGLHERAVRGAGAALRTTDGASDGDDESATLLRGVADVFAKVERMAIKRRTRDALAVMKREGKRTGGIPWGSRLAADGVHLEAEPLEQATTEAARALVAEGYSLAKASAELARWGVVNRAGNPFSKCALHFMLAAA